MQLEMLRFVVVKDARHLLSLRTEVVANLRGGSGVPRFAWLGKGLRGSPGG